MVPFLFEVRQTKRAKARGRNNSQAGLVKRKTGNEFLFIRKSTKERARKKLVAD